jgi:hypothetical protein
MQHRLGSISKVLTMPCGSKQGQYIMPHSARIWPELNENIFMHLKEHQFSDLLNCPARSSHLSYNILVNYWPDYFSNDWLGLLYWSI